MEWFYLHGYTWIFQAFINSNSQWNEWKILWKKQTIKMSNRKMMSNSKELFCWSVGLWVVIHWIWFNCRFRCTKIFYRWNIQVYELFTLKNCDFFNVFWVQNQFIHHNSIDIHEWIALNVRPCIASQNCCVEIHQKCILIPFVLSSDECWHLLLCYWASQLIVAHKLIFLWF